MYCNLGLPYIISNLGLAGTGCWAIATSPDLEPFTIYAITFIFTIVNDMMCLGIYDKKQVFTKDGTDAEKFGIGMAITNLILKAFSVFLLYKEFTERMGGTGHEGKSGYEPFPRSAAGSTAVFGPNYSNIYPQPGPNSFQPGPNNFQPSSNNFQPASNNYQPASGNFQPASGNYLPLGEGTTK